MTRIVWLSGDTYLMACHSLANACHNGKPGDHVHQSCSCGKPGCRAALASHVIVESKSGKKRAVRIRA